MAGYKFFQIVLIVCALIFAIQDKYDKATFYIAVLIFLTNQYNA